MIRDPKPTFSDAVARRAIQAVAAGADTATEVATVLGYTEKQVVCILDLLVERGVLTEIGNLRYVVSRRPSLPRHGHRVPSTPTVLEARERAEVLGLGATMDHDPDDHRSHPAQTSLATRWRARLRSWWRLEDLVGIPVVPRESLLYLGPESRWLMTLTLVTICAVAWVTWTSTPEPGTDMSQAELSGLATHIDGHWAGQLSGEPFFLQLRGTGESLFGALTVDVGTSSPVVKAVRGTATHSDGQLIITMVEQGTSSPDTLTGTLSDGRLVGSAKISGVEKAAWWAARP